MSVCITQGLGRNVVCFTGRKGYLRSGEAVREKNSREKED